MKTIAIRFIDLFRKDGEVRLYRIFFASGLLTALPLIFPYLFFLSYVSLIPMLLMLLKHGAELRKRRAYAVGLFFGFGYFGALYHWFTSLYPMEFADLSAFQSIAVILVCWLGLMLLQSLEFGFVTLIYRLIKPNKNKPILGGALFIALWVLFEYQETLGWRGVPWGRLALSQSKAPVFLQSASLFGSYFVSAVIVSVNVFLALMIHYIFDSDGKRLREKITASVKAKKSVICASVALGIFSLNLIFGAVRLAVYDENAGESVNVAVIQGNISSLEKWEVNAVDKSADKYIELTRECAEKSEAKIDIAVWPETVIPTALNYKNSKTVNKISEMAEELRMTVLVGAFEVTYDKTTLTSNEYNSIYVFNPDGTVSEETYRKRRLVPFGEYTPMESFIQAFLPILSSLNLLSDPLTAGTDSEIFDTEYGKIGSLICFDSIYESLALDSVRDGAELITLSTNDSWFGDSSAVWQHNSHAALRAIETGRYVVRAANTGVSSVITPEGKILTEIDPLVTGYASATVHIRSDRTLYSYIGDLFVLTAFIGATAIAAYPHVIRLIKAVKEKEASRRI